MMVQGIASRVLRWTVAASLLTVFSAVTPDLSAAEAQAGKTASKKERRLPPHYAAVVTNQQRQQIYQIQAEYQPKIETLKSQLEALRKERAEKIAALLTDEQKKQIEEATAKANSRPKAK